MKKSKFTRWKKWKRPKETGVWVANNLVEWAKRWAKEKEIKRLRYKPIWRKILGL